MCAILGDAIAEKLHQRHRLHEHVLDDEERVDALATELARSHHLQDDAKQVVNALLEFFGGK